MNKLNPKSIYLKNLTDVVDNDFIQETVHHTQCIK